MRRNLILAAGLFACLIPVGTFAQKYRKTVTVEVYLPEGARLFIEGQETRSTGPMRRLVLVKIVRMRRVGHIRAHQKRSPQRNFGGAYRVLLNRSRDRQRYCSGWMFIRKQPLLSEEARRQLHSSEPMPQKVASLYAIAAVERGELVGKRRRCQFG